MPTIGRSNIRGCAHGGAKVRREVAGKLAVTVVSEPSVEACGAVITGVSRPSTHGRHARGSQILRAHAIFMFTYLACV